MMRQFQNNIDGRKKAIYVVLLVIFSVFLIFVCWQGIVQLTKNNETNKNNKANTDLVLQSGILSFEEPQGRSFSCIQEPWIALFKNMTKDSQWHVIGSSQAGILTDTDLTQIKTWILCEGYQGNHASYNTYINGVKTATTDVGSEAVSIRCLNLINGTQYGKDEILEAKKMPKSISKTSDLLYSDSQVMNEVTRIVTSKLCPGYPDNIEIESQSGIVTGVKTGTRSDDNIYIIPGTATAIRSIGRLSNSFNVLYVPDSVSMIEDGALDSISFVIVESGSYAHRYAMEHGILFKETENETIIVPDSLTILDLKRFYTGKETLQKIWETTSSKALYISPHTEVNGSLSDLEKTSLRFLVDRDSPAESYFLEQSMYSYTYYNTWNQAKSDDELSPGSIVTLGRFEQDGIVENGPEPIEWFVLSNDGESCLLLSRLLLGTGHTDKNRSEMEDHGFLWLYEEFAPSAFTEKELSIIQGEELTEKVFLPNVRDILGYCATEEERMAVPSTVVTNEEGNPSVWLLADYNRSCYYGKIINQDYASSSIRPAIRVNIAALTALEPQNVPFVLPENYEKVFFGTRNNGESLPWLILERSENKYLLLSAEAEEYLTSFSNGLQNEVWENSRMRSWLNDEFIKRSFTSEEKEAILETRIEHGSDTGSLIYQSNQEPTIDRVFLLSLSELKQYFPLPSSRILFDSSSNVEPWWLRSCASDYVRLAVNQYGHLYGYTSTSTTAACIRPAIWVDAKKVDELLSLNK